jgi:ketosteroid isomerase-like protein
LTAITEADVACVWRAYEEFTRRFEELRTDDGLRRYHAEFYVPDAVMDNTEFFPAATSYVGVDGYQQWFGETLAPFVEVAWDVESVEVIGGRVFSMAWIRGREPSDGTLLEVRLALSYTMREARIARIEVFLDEGKAREAARATA